MTTEFVYCAWRGVAYEGNELLGVFRTETAARAQLALAQAQAKHASADNWYVTQEKMLQ